MKINLIGTGAVAQALLDRLQGKIRQIAGRHPDKVAALAHRWGITACAIHEIDANAAVTLVCVSDDAIAGLSAQLPLGSHLVVHTSGAQDLSCLAPHRHRGILYPLQTFHPDHSINWEAIHWFLTGEDERLQALAQALQPKTANIHPITPLQKTQLHLAAVLACNFSQFFWAEAARLLKQQNLTLEVLAPLLQQALQNSLQQPEPRSVITGPARRGDWKSIDKHIALLENDPELRDLYERISRAIHALPKP